MSIFFKKRTSASVPTPGAGKVALFIDSADGNTKTKDETGAITALVPIAYTDEQAQDAVGGMWVDTNSIDVTYDDASNSISAKLRIYWGGLVTAASKVYGLTDWGVYYERTNSGAAMTDTLPTLSASDNGYSVKVANIGTTVTETITFTAAAGTLPGGATTYVLNFGCRQTFVWTGTKWLFDAGNGNIVKVSPGTTPVVAGNLPKFGDTTGRNVGDSGFPAALATTTTNGFQAAADKARQNNLAQIEVNILDFGGAGDNATANDTALTSAIAALPAAGGVVIFPAGTFLFTTAYTVSANNVRIQGVGPNATTLRYATATGDQITISGYGSGIDGCNIQGPGSGTTSSKTAGYGVNLTGTESFCNNCDFQYQWNALGLNGALADAYHLWIRYFANTGIVVNQNSDHRIARVSMDNAPATLPATAGIDVQQTASLQLVDLNVIHSNWALNLSPANGVTIPSVKALNCFFDTSAIGLRMAGAGAVLRSEFTNCWFSSMSVAGVLMAPTGTGSVDGITFCNCDIYNNVGGTTVGISITTALVGKWKLIGSSIAGWTTGIAMVAGANHYPSLIGNTIGAVSAFGINATGVSLAAGAYKGFVMVDNDMADNTTPFIDSSTFAASAQKLISNNIGLTGQGVAKALLTTPTITTVQTALAQVPVPANSLLVGTTFRAKLACTLSAAGTPSFVLRLGTAGTTADTALITHAPVQAALGGIIEEIVFTVRTVGAAGTSSATAYNSVTGVVPSATNATQLAATPAVNTTVANFLTLTASSTAGNLIVNAATIECIA